MLHSRLSSNAESKGNRGACSTNGSPSNMTRPATSCSLVCTPSRWPCTRQRCSSAWLVDAPTAGVHGASAVSVTVIAGVGAPSGVPRTFCNAAIRQNEEGEEKKKKNKKKKKNNRQTESGVLCEGLKVRRQKENATRQGEHRHKGAANTHCLAVGLDAMGLGQGLQPTAWQRREVFVGGGARSLPRRLRLGHGRAGLLLGTLSALGHLVALPCCRTKSKTTKKMKPTRKQLAEEKSQGKGGRGWPGTTASTTAN